MAHKTEEEINSLIALVKKQYNGADQVSIDRYLNAFDWRRSYAPNPVTPEDIQEENAVLARLLGERDYAIGLSFRSRVNSILSTGSNGANLPVFDFADFRGNG
jgi:hypothetical protein